MGIRRVPSRWASFGLFFFVGVVEVVLSVPAASVASNAAHSLLECASGSCAQAELSLGRLVQNMHMLLVVGAALYCGGAGVYGESLLFVICGMPRVILIVLFASECTSVRQRSAAVYLLLRFAAACSSSPRCLGGVFSFLAERRCRPFLLVQSCF